MKKKKTRFLRIGYTQYSKLGLRRKKKQKYRKGKGGENKMRLKMKGHLRNVSIGFRNKKKTRGLIGGLKIIRVQNIEGIKNIKKNEIGIVAKMGNKKRIGIAEYSLKNNIRLINMNPKKFLESIEEEKKKAKEDRTKRSEKKKTRDKKAKEAEKKEGAEKEDKKETIEESVKNNESDIKENVEEIK